MACPPGQGAPSWAPLLQQISPDSRAFRTDLLPKHQLAVRVGAAVGVGVAAALLAALVGAVRAAAGVAAGLL